MVHYRLTVFDTSWDPKGTPNHSDGIETWCRYRSLNLEQFEKNTSIPGWGWDNDADSDLGFA